MPSAKQFLGLVAEKDLVSDNVIQAAEAEMAKSTPAGDAVAAAGWMVQNQHLTPSQAERLLATLSGAREAASSKAPPPTSPPSQRPQLAEDDDLGFAPLEDAPAVKPKPSQAAPAANKPSSEKPSTEKPAAKDEHHVEGTTVSIAGQLGSSADAMIGPLDALIDSESTSSDPFGDPMAATGGPDLGTPTPKKFKLSRWIKSVFRRAKSKTVRVEAADPKQVRIVLITWGGAVLALAAVLAAFYALSPKSPDDLLHDAQDAMAKRNYAAAVETFDHLLKNYPTSSHAADVRVMRGIAELRRAGLVAEGSSNWLPAFDVAQAQIKILPKETAYPDHAEEIGVALATIGEGLANQSQSQPSPEVVSRTRSILQMIATNMPRGKQPTEMVGEISRLLEKSDRVVSRHSELDDTLIAVRDAVKQGELKPAYTAYNTLVRQFPELADDAELIEAMKAVSAGEQNAVRVVKERKAAIVESRPSDMIAVQPLVVRPLQHDVPAAQGKQLFVADQGVVYGINAASGQVQWRRFVPWDAKAVQPALVPIVEPSATDVVACDTIHREVVRLHGSSGKVVWRQAFTEAIAADPVVMGTRLLVVTNDKRLSFVDLATGDVAGYVALPQAVRLPPVVDAGRGLIFLTAEQSNLFVLRKGQCRQVFHLGHGVGKVAAPPTIVGDFLLVAVNEGAADATLHVLSIHATEEEKEGRLLNRMQRIPVKGSVASPAVLLGSGAVVPTAQGGLLAVERDLADAKSPFRVAAQRDPASDDKIQRYAAAEGKRLWVADSQLARYEINAAAGQIESRAITDRGSRFVQPPMLLGDVLFHIRKRGTSPGLMVSAVSANDQEPIWQTWVAAPLASEPLVDAASGKFTAITASGGMFRLALDDLREGKPVPKPLLAIEPGKLAKPIAAATQLDGGMFAMTAGAGTKPIVVYDPKEDDKRFRFLLSPGEMASAPCAFGGGVLVPCINGQVHLLDPRTFGELAKPFERPVKGVEFWEWRSPVVAGEKRAVLCDGDKRLFVISIEGDSEPTLVSSGAATMPKALVSPLAVLGENVFVVDASDKLLTFALPNLTPGRQHDLGGHCLLGPRRVGKLVLVSSDKDRLFAFDEKQELVWQTPLPYGALAGAPYSVGDELIVAARSGTIARISAADGKELSHVNAGCTLGTGPVLVSGRMIVGGSDGSAIEVKNP